MAQNNDPLGDLIPDQGAAPAAPAKSNNSCLVWGLIIVGAVLGLIVIGGCVMIVVLAALGPAIGNIFSNITSTL